MDHPATRHLSDSGAGKDRAKVDPASEVAPGVAGRLDSPTGTGQAGSVECGSMVRIDLAVTDGMVSDSRYQAYGCPATLSAASWTAGRIVGRTFLEAALVGAEEIRAGAALSPENRACAETAADALHAALGAAATSGAPLVAANAEKEARGVLVGMSGGVDSTVAAMLLRRQGLHVVGATLSLWREDGVAGERSCCSPETVRRARRVAHALGIPHLTIDASETFSEEVVSYFVEEYARGRTPNPCAKCNARVRFGLMLAVARRLGLSSIATGHYARLLGAGRSLARGVDRRKDQSYVLAEVAPEVLRSVLFPLGEMTKPAVRELAAVEGVEGYSAPESQEICFIPDDDHRRFLRQRLGSRPGRVVDQNGATVTEHEGIYNYTIGQRRGLGIAAESPLYVLSVDAEENEVRVGPAEALDVVEVAISDVVWHRDAPEGEILLQVRSAGEPAPGILVLSRDPRTPGVEAKEVCVRLLRPIRAVACGQTAVVYSDSDVVCAGTISAAACDPRGRPTGEGTSETGPVV